MPELSTEGRRAVAEVAERHGVGTATAEALLVALAAGGGTQAQFNLPEIGGMGQWSRGGMVMVGDMFDNALKARVDALCTDLAGLLAAGGALARPSQSQSQSRGQGAGAGVSLFVPGTAPGAAWWPEELGTPASVGAQNDMRYAFFPVTRRLAVDLAGRIRVYDTGDHQLTGFSQQQSGDQSLTFTSQHGLVRVADLAEVSADAAAEPAPAAPTAQAFAADASASPASGGDDVFAKLERLADLHARGIVSAQEFETKKAELLARI
jgi:hypothetical protein